MVKMLNQDDAHRTGDRTDSRRVKETELRAGASKGNGQDSWRAGGFQGQTLLWGTEILVGLLANTGRAKRAGTACWRRVGIQAGCGAHAFNPSSQQGRDRWLSVSFMAVG